MFVNTTETLVHLTYTSGAGRQLATLNGTPGHPFWSVMLGGDGRIYTRCPAADAGHQRHRNQHPY